MPGWSVDVAVGRRVEAGAVQAGAGRLLVVGPRRGVRCWSRAAGRASARRLRRAPRRARAGTPTADLLAADLGLVERVLDERDDARLPEPRRRRGTPASGRRCLDRGVGGVALVAERVVIVGAIDSSPSRRHSSAISADCCAPFMSPGTSRRACLGVLLLGLDAGSWRCSSAEILRRRRAASVERLEERAPTCASRCRSPRSGGCSPRSALSWRCRGMASRRSRAAAGEQATRPATTRRIISVCGGDAATGTRPGGVVASAHAGASCGGARRPRRRRTRLGRLLGARPIPRQVDLFRDAHTNMTAARREALAAVEGAPMDATEELPPKSTPSWSSGATGSGAAGLRRVRDGLRGARRALRRAVAVKVMPARPDRCPSAAQREALAAARLDHPGSSRCSTRARRAGAVPGLRARPGPHACGARARGRAERSRRVRSAWRSPTRSSTRTTAVSSTATSSRRT